MDVTRTQYIRLCEYVWGLIRSRFQAEIEVDSYLQKIREIERLHPDWIEPLSPSRNGYVPIFGEIDTYLFSHGTHYRLYEKLGAHCMEHCGRKGVAFLVWAPFARSLVLRGKVGPIHSMIKTSEIGVWEIFIPGLLPGALYSFEIEGIDGVKKIKTDPMGMQFEVRPKTSSIVVDEHKYQWKDHEWMCRRKQQDLNKPITVYEVHLGTWKRKNGEFCAYKELAERLSQYCLHLGFTHVELMPVAEHPLDESWGYQTTGFFAPTSRHGSFQDFQQFMDIMHQAGIGVIVDWVPGHFSTDDFALSRFDGTALYEHEAMGLHPHWTTNIFNFERSEVVNFLLAAALFWCERLHIDGLRVDAVASMLYLDYGRENRSWMPNRWGGRENLDAIEFLKHFNSIVHECFPGVITIAEESTAFPGVTHPLHTDGLGFDLKWNMGWMHDTLQYFSVDSYFRTYHQNEITFNLLYAFTEKFILPLSHDEVVHGKKTLLAKMPGDIWQKFANLRLLFSYMMCQPGKKLLFMGAELGTWDEWWTGVEMPWSILSYPYHQGIQNCVRDLNHLYQSREELFGDDFSNSGFEWVDFQDSSNSIVSYLRKSHSKSLFCIHNFTPTYFEAYKVPLTHIQHVKEIFNSDDMHYGGSGKIKGLVDIQELYVELSIPPLATVIYEVVQKL